MNEERMDCLIISVVKPSSVNEKRKKPGNTRYSLDSRKTKSILCFKTGGNEQKDGILCVEIYVSKVTLCVKKHMCQKITRSRELLFPFMVEFAFLS